MTRGQFIWSLLAMVSIFLAIIISMVGLLLALILINHYGAPYFTVLTEQVGTEVTSLLLGLVMLLYYWAQRSIFTSVAYRRYQHAQRGFSHIVLTIVERLSYAISFYFLIGLWKVLAALDFTAWLLSAGFIFGGAWLIHRQAQRRGLQ